MNTSDIIAGVSAFIALGALAVSFYAARKVDQAENRANAFLAGQAENELRNQIRATNNRVSDLFSLLEDFLNGRKIEELTDPEKTLLQQKKLRLKSELEEVLNAYENACAKYVDDKIDRERFSKHYRTEIRNIFEKEPKIYNDFLHPEGTSKYKVLWRVYREWNDTENVARAK